MALSDEPLARRQADATSARPSDRRTTSARTRREGDVKGVMLPPWMTMADTWVLVWESCKPCAAPSRLDNPAAGRADRPLTRTLSTYILVCYIRTSGKGGDAW